MSGVLITGHGGARVVAAACSFRSRAAWLHSVRQLRHPMRRVASRCLDPLDDPLHARCSASLVQFHREPDARPDIPCLAQFLLTAT